MCLLPTVGTGLSPGNLYPWTWARDDRESFKALQASGANRAGVLVAPILQKLILNRKPREVLEWADRVASWDFKRIIPCHLANDIAASPQDFRSAFAFLEERKTLLPLPKLISAPAAAGVKSEDLFLLATASELLTEAGVVDPPAPKVTKESII